MNMKNTGFKPKDKVEYYDTFTKQTERGEIFGFQSSEDNGDYGDYVLIERESGGCTGVYVDSTFKKL